jgi:two-component system cell cycle sensor histidine kinase/response regulator CckA
LDELVGEWRGTGAVLVVDDEESVRTVAQLILQEFGFTVLTATDGCEGLEVFRAHSDEIVAVLLDMTMPKMGGEDALGELRAIRPDMPILLSSGYDEQESAKLFVSNGPIAFIQKPYQSGDLIAKIRKVLEGRA